MIKIAFSSVALRALFAFCLVLFFQNCSPVRFSDDLASLSPLDAQGCASDPTLCPTTEPLVCKFNGAIYYEGQTVTAYLYSSVPVGQLCQSQVRTCTKGVFGGSYPFAYCEVGAPASCLFNGQTIAHGQTVKAYQNSSVAYGQQCASEARLCNNGVLGGNYNYASCDPGAPKSCLFDGKTIPHGESVKSYKESSVAFGQTCAEETRVCTNGALSGSNAYSVCAVDVAKSCLFDGKTIPHGGSVKAYQNSAVPYGSSCASQDRICSNGNLSGNYQYGSCDSGTAASCLFNGRTIAHGQKVIVYPSTEVGAGSACTASERICSNGTLGGPNYTAETCMVKPATVTYSWSAGSYNSCSASANYTYGAWGTCSSSGTQTRTASCASSSGTQTRSVYCQGSDGSVASDSNCFGSKPVSSTSCSASCMGTAVTSQSCVAPISYCSGGSFTFNSPDGSNTCSFTFPRTAVGSNATGTLISATYEASSAHLFGDCRADLTWNYRNGCPNRVATTCTGGSQDVRSADGSRICRFSWGQGSQGDNISVSGTNGGTGSASCTASTNHWQTLFTCPNAVATKVCAAGELQVESSSVPGKYCIFNWSGAAVGQTGVASQYNPDRQGSLSALCEDRGDAFGMWRVLSKSCN